MARKVTPTSNLQPKAAAVQVPKFAKARFPKINTTTHYNGAVPKKHSIPLGAPFVGKFNTVIPPTSVTNPTY